MWKWLDMCNTCHRTWHIKTKHVQTASHLCLGEFAPVWFQVVNNAIKSSWQWDAMKKQDHQDQIWEHSCEIYNLHTHKDTLLYCALIFQPKCKTSLSSEMRYFWIITDLCLLSQYESTRRKTLHAHISTGRANNQLTHGQHSGLWSIFSCSQQTIVIVQLMCVCKG